VGGWTEGCIELIAAVFRLAVADYVGQSYSHDGCAPTRKASQRHRADASTFLTGAWARYLADQVGLEAGAIWRDAKRLDACILNVKQTCEAT